MQRVADELVVSPTDLTKFLGCAHATALDIQVANGERRKPYSRNDELLDLLFEKGDQHEHRYLDLLRADHVVVEIASEDRSASERATETEQAMRDGAGVICQAAFFHDCRLGYADF